MSEESWIHPALYTRPVPEKGGVGVFSKEYLPSGVLVGIPAGGAIYSTSDTKRLSAAWGDYFHQVGAYAHWGPKHEDDIDILDRMNHSCDPTAWWKGDMQLVVRREIQPHRDELTWDYATSESYKGYGFSCLCGAALCRGKMSADDWIRLDLQVRYEGHFQSYLRRKIETRWKENHLRVEGGALYYTDNYDPQAPYWHKIIGNEQGIIYNRRSAFQHIQIFETKYGKMLVLDGYPQLSEGDRHIYTEALGLPPLLAHTHPRRVYLFGAGDGDLLSFVMAGRRVKKAVMVEIDPDVIAATQQNIPRFWEGALPHLASGRAEIRIANVMDFLDQEREPADIIYWDLTDPEEGNLATPLMNAECFAKAARLLRKDGIFAMQAGEKTPLFAKGHEYARSLLEKVFPYVISGAVPIGSFSTSWGFLFASQKPLPPFGNVALVRRLFQKRPRPYNGITPHYTAERIAAMFA